MIEESRRQALMRVCSQASEGELEQAVATFGESTRGAEDLRAPEIGTVMLQGRVGGDGRAFNFGEATVTRAAVRLATGEVGFGYLLGRSKQRARLAALMDALGQCAALEPAIETAFVAPVSARVAAEQAAEAQAVAKTRVDFFTVARAED